MDEFLPSKLPYAKVFLFDCTPPAPTAKEYTSLDLDTHAEELLEQLLLCRKSVANGPIVFLSHSLGGFVVKIVRSRILDIGS